MFVKFALCGVTVKPGRVCAKAGVYNFDVRILLLNLYYPPDTSATAKMAATVVSELAKEHQVTVLCGRPSYDPTERRRWRWCQAEKSQNLEILRVGSTDFPRIEMKRRILNYLTYTALVIPRALIVPCDVVLAMTDPPFEGIVGALVALFKRKPYVYNIRDMYPDMAVGGSIVQPGLLTRLWEKLHRLALRRASTIVVLGEDMRNRIVTKGVRAERVAVVRDGAEIQPDVVDAANRLDNEVVRAIRADFRFVVLHAGNLGFYGAWSSLIDAAKQLEKENIGLVFVGDGAQRQELQSLANGATNVRFLPFFPAAKIPSVLAAADAHLVTIKRGLEGVVVPSKMYGILTAGKPIVAVAPAATDAVTLGEAMGYSVGADPDNPADIASVICSLANDPAKVGKMCEAARKAAPGFGRQGELRKFLEIVMKASNPISGER